MKLQPSLLSKVVTFCAVAALFAGINPQNANASDPPKSLIKQSEATVLVKQLDNAAKDKPDDEDDADSANSGKTSKSWTVENPEYWNDGFLNSLKWVDHKAGDYTLSTGIIYGKWIAAMKWLRNGKVVLVEYTPPYEYVLPINTVTGEPVKHFDAFDANHDGVLEMAFLHEKLDDKKYHLYTVYALEKSLPRLIWKSGGTLGDWVSKSDPNRPSKAFAKSHAEHRD